mmetsp:Transcript_22442/g.49042  ORF Transcript_22442/g.49042 Transcript_22442/m.49042 type:complete len:335 (-) Transcript_22442:1390-2394(-)
MFCLSKVRSYASMHLLGCRVLDCHGLLVSRWQGQPRGVDAPARLFGGCRQLIQYELPCCTSQGSALEATHLKASCDGFPEVQRITEGHHQVTGGRRCSRGAAGAACGSGCRAALGGLAPGSSTRSSGCCCVRCLCHQCCQLLLHEWVLWCRGVFGACEEYPFLPAAPPQRHQKLLLLVRHVHLHDVLEVGPLVGGLEHHCHLGALPLRQRALCWPCEEGGLHLQVGVLHAPEAQREREGEGAGVGHAERLLAALALVQVTQVEAPGQSLSRLHTQLRSNALALERDADPRLARTEGQHLQVLCALLGVEAGQHLERVARPDDTHRIHHTEHLRR